MSGGEKDVGSSASYRFLVAAAVSGAVLWVGWEAWRHFSSFTPLDREYLAGNRAFKDGHYHRARDDYYAALALDSDHVPSLRALANVYVQLGDLSSARSMIDRAIRLSPDVGVHYAARGIILDRLGRYGEAAEDYALALELDPELADGMHWLDRLLYNVGEPPPTIADRLEYLRDQLSRPAEERLLRVPDLDDAQRPYEQ